jgi:hypothetical protein
LLIESLAFSINPVVTTTSSPPPRPPQPAPFACQMFLNRGPGACRVPVAQHHHTVACAHAHAHSHDATPPRAHNPGQLGQWGVFIIHASRYMGIMGTQKPISAGRPPLRDCPHTFWRRPQIFAHYSALLSSSVLRFASRRSTAPSPAPVVTVTAAGSGHAADRSNLADHHLSVRAPLYTI